MLGRRSTRSLRAALGTLAALGWLAAPAAAERVRGTAVSLDPPPGFSASKQVAGYQQDATGSSIVVTELAGPVSEVTAAMSADGLATQGMRLLDSVETTAAGRSALLIHAAQSKAGVEIEKWMLAVGERNRTVLVIATFPKEGAELLREPLRAAVLSVQWSPQIEPVRTEGLPFAVAQTADLKVSQRVGNTLMLARPGAPVKVDPAAPLLVVGMSRSDIAITDVENFARDRVRRTSEIAEVSAIEGETLRVDGLQAYELRAVARDQQSGAPLRVYQLIVADGTRYFLAQGRVGAERAELFLPQFRDVGRSLRRRGK